MVGAVSHLMWFIDDVGIKRHQHPAAIALLQASPLLYEALQMVADADDDCRRDGLQTIPSVARTKIDAALALARGQT